MTPQLPYEMGVKTVVQMFFHAFVMNGYCFWNCLTPEYPAKSPHARGTLGIWYPSCLTPLKEPLHPISTHTCFFGVKGIDYQLGPHPKGFPTIFPMIMIVLIKEPSKFGGFL